MINQLLDLAILDSDKFNLQAAPQPIVSSPESMVGPFESLSAQDQIKLSIHCDEEKITIYFDVEKLEITKINLVIRDFV